MSLAWLPPNSPISSLTQRERDLMDRPGPLVREAARVCALAPELSRLVLDFYLQPDLVAERKADGTPVTAADLAADDFLCEHLPHIINVPVVSEERVVSTSSRLAWRRFWVIDPIDGTTNFLDGDDRFSISIALVQDRRPVLGIIILPALQKTYVAAVGHGAFLVQDDEWIRICNETTRAPVLHIDSYTLSRPETLRLVTELGIRDASIVVEPVGEAYRFTQIADGAFDLGVRWTPTNEWDVAAGDCILHEAGCRLVNPVSGLPFLYNTPRLRFQGAISFREDLEARLSSCLELR
jgi:3'(2'), 5'-bisphosphate nucleotidase